MGKLDNFCCICIQNREEVLCINDVENNIKYIKKLSFCVPAGGWKEYYKICKLCAGQLNIAYSFLKVCIESESIRKKELEPSNEDKEIQYTCDYCNRSFKQKKYLCQHITKLHIKKEGKQIIKKESHDVSISEELKSGNVKPEEQSLAIVNENNSIEFEENCDNEILKGDECKLANDSLLKFEHSYCGNETFKPDYDSKLDVKSDSDDYREDNDTSGENNDNYQEDNDTRSGDEEFDVTDKKTRKKKVCKKRRSLQCSFCSETFSTRLTWSTHVRTVHSFEKPFTCDQCECRYMNAYSLLIHKRKHSNEKPFICATCGKCFVSSADLNHHNKTHNLNRAYPCPSCDRSYKTHSNLRTHRLQMHLDPSEWKYLCNLCDKKFPIRGNLVKHLKRHAGVKDFHCHVCAKKFFNMAEMRLHIRTHTNQTHFNCKYCKKEYKNREGLRRHLKVVHGEGNWKPPKNEKKYLCPWCPKLFVSCNKLQRHIFTHTGEKPYKCEYCQKGFIDNYERKVHCRKEHDIDN
ncbi:zinc finger protein 271-like [Sitophilus oryzae]|uniref:Zinc finger protein 271-like n=1 Tax=Sitophilus oryzae TaxID=7048 RepID=A0A6J2XVB8_SITOR|nr:zinc finger protein 271-like [Sitophilus oryzae]